MSKFSRDLVEQIDKTSKWVEEDETVRGNIPIIGFSYGFSLLGNTGEVKFSRKFALLDMKQEVKPEFAKDMSTYVNDIVDEFKDKLIDAIDELALGDPWASPIPSNLSSNVSSEMSTPEVESPVASGG